MDMDMITLGRTGLHVSVLGLGGGGHSRLGQRTGASEAHSVALIQRALELGVTFIDTAEAYGTEALVGQALRSVRRRDVVISTKKSLTKNGQLIRATDLIHGLEQSLTRLQTEYVDIYHLHGVRPEHYQHAVAELLPALNNLREQGKIRFLGITEAFAVDPGHILLQQAVRDDYWDVVMVGFNILNQSARARVLAETMQRNIGVLCMFAVRDALSQPEKLRQTIAELLQHSLIDPALIDRHDPLGFLRAVASSMPEAAYRFCRAEPGIHVVLSGTGNRDHLEQNVAAVHQPPLPEAIRQQLIDLFARVDTVSGE
jgi:aryl-alcohol dehydrogenase-like predicted oxidoreductase